MDILDAVLGAIGLPWWLWAMLIGVALILAGYILVVWLPVLGGFLMLITGFVGALWRRS